MTVHTQLDPAYLQPEETADSAPVEALPSAGDVQRGLVTSDVPTAWQLAAFSGRLGEISGTHGSAALTLAFRLVLEAQRQGEPVAWIARKESVFYPPDVAAAAVDLEALVVVRVSEPLLAARAADQLVRSGAFGLVVLDLGENARVPTHAQARLVGLAKKHHTAVLCITEKDSERPSVGSLVSIRAEAVRAQKLGAHFLCEARILKDKRSGPGWTHREVCRGPDGLR
jgi:recombination protein RecA